MCVGYQDLEFHLLSLYITLFGIVGKQQQQLLLLQLLLQLQLQLRTTTTTTQIIAISMLLGENADQPLDFGVPWVPKLFRQTQVGHIFPFRIQLKTLETYCHLAVS
jgi:hypothetical protein